MSSAEPWRYRCPEGHCSWSPRVAGYFYCERCDERFPELVDTKRRSSA